MTDQQNENAAGVNGLAAIEQSGNPDLATILEQVRIGVQDQMERDGNNDESESMQVVMGIFEEITKTVGDGELANDPSLIFSKVGGIVGRMMGVHPIPKEDSDSSGLADNLDEIVDTAFQYEEGNSSDSRHFSYIFMNKGIGEQVLSADVKRCIISNWLSIKDVGRLDSAMTNNTGRPYFLSLLEGMRSPSFDSYHYGELCLLRWVGKKRIELREVSSFFTEMKEGETPLMWALRTNERDLAVLLAHSTDINSQCDRTPAQAKREKVPHKGTALHYACHKSEVSIVSALLLKSSRIDVRAKDGLFQTPLHYCAALEDGVDVEMANLLLGHIKDNIKKSQKKACNNNNKDNTRGKDQDQEDQDDSNQLISALEDLDQSGQSPLSVACISGKATLARLLVESGAFVDYYGDAKGQTALHHVARAKSPNSHGNGDLLRFLLSVQDSQIRPRGSSLSQKSQKGEVGSVDLPDTEGKTALHTACTNGNLECMKVLLEAGADILATDLADHTVLHCLCEAVNPNSDISPVVRHLLSCEPDLLDKTDQKGNTALHLACTAANLGAVEVLLQIDTIKLNSQNELGFTPLHCAASKGKLDICTALVRAGADVNIQGKQGSTPLILTCYKSYRTQMDITKLLVLEGKAECDINAKQGTALTLAVQADNLELARFLMQEGHSIADVVVGGWDHPNEDTTLHYACRKNMLAMAELLLTEGAASVNQQNAEKKTPLMLACMLEGDFTEKEKVDLLVSLLVEHGASDEAEDKEGWTALHHACSNKHHEPIRRMLGVGLGNVDCMTRECISPLIIACMQSDDDLAQFLLKEHKADYSTQDIHGNTALHFALMTDNVYLSKLIMRHVSNVSVSEEEKGEVMNKTNFTGDTPLHLALEKGSKSAVKLMISPPFSARVDIENNLGQSAVAIMRKKGWDDLLALVGTG